MSETIATTTTTTTPDGDTDIETYLDAGGPKKWYRRKRVWLGLLLLIALAALTYTCTRDAPPPDYITAEVEQRSLDLTVTATGALRPTNQVEVGSEVSGKIDRIMVDVNDQVARGQILAVINTDVIDDQITQGRANLDAARAQVAQAQATLDADIAQLRRLQDVQRLSGGRVPAQAELEQAEASVRRGQASVAAARANVVASQAQLSTAQTNRNRAVVRSPVSGVVLARQVEPGQTVAASFNTPTLFVIAENLSTMQLRVDLDEADVGQVDPGQRATFTVDAYPGRRFPATVERVDLGSNTTALGQQAQAQASQQVVSYEARLNVTNTEGLLRPGMTATATIATQSTGRAMLVPNGALRFEPEAEEEEGGMFGQQNFGLEEESEATIGVGSRQQVHVVEADGSLRAIEVVTGQSDGRMTVVTSAELEPGMNVVTGLRAAGQ
ncbi:efflux RND transporter periplasmic adaptor subunit [Erythrobacter arachoides]|uniref:Efflux RND transporter periplasmic adaptor subunit n=1 Tax=Aurantiacibacter arachoides TaxID=1850444 RepID=A0A845A3W8_9SPHN|nr:efflux RND transporter periplasmic adaptor subunit [Aurantiacibacter arachoides]MXO93826.1 efflux RND transporter periplasmic adaptor subunit [Aurantiacibacter arachoides]GGD46392.1 secretion protein HlyD [Aurantiacibacter arachoides]